MGCHENLYQYRNSYPSQVEFNAFSFNAKILYFGLFYDRKYNIPISFNCILLQISNDKMLTC